MLPCPETGPLLFTSNRQRTSCLGRLHDLANSASDARGARLLASAGENAATFSAAGGAAGAPTLLTDERLRERDLGILDGYTGGGIRERYPEEAERRDRIGKFYATVRYVFEPTTASAVELVWENPFGFTVTDYRVTAESLEAQNMEGQK